MHGETHLNPTSLHRMISDEELSPENERAYFREKANG